MEYVAFPSLIANDKLKFSAEYLLKDNSAKTLGRF